MYKSTVSVPNADEDSVDIYDGLDVGVGSNAGTNFYLHHATTTGSTQMRCLTCCSENSQSALKLS